MKTQAKLCVNNPGKISAFSKLVKKPPRTVPDSIVMIVPFILSFIKITHVTYDNKTFLFHFISSKVVYSIRIIYIPGS